MGWASPMSGVRLPRRTMPDRATCRRPTCCGIRPPRGTNCWRRTSQRRARMSAHFMRAITPALCPLQCRRWSPSPTGTSRTTRRNKARYEDWVKFYAATDSVYEVKGRQLGTNSDVRLEIYYQHSDGSLEFIDFADDNGTGVGFTEVLTLDMRTGQSGLLAGMYYVRIVSADTSLFGPGSDYSLQIYVPGGVEGGPVLLCDCGGPLFTIGRFSVYMDPPQAVTAGAGWLITEVTGMGYSNTIATYGLPFQTETMYHVAFRPVAGFLTPSNSPFVLNTNYTNHTTNIQAYYTYTNPSPRAESFTRGTDSSVNITYLGRAGKGYAIEESTNLLNWTPLSTNQIPQDGLLHFTATNRSANVRAFYRAHLVP